MGRLDDLEPVHRVVGAPGNTAHSRRTRALTRRGAERNCVPIYTHACIEFRHISSARFAFSALILFAGRREEHPARKN